MTYRLSIPGLEESVQRANVEAKHTALLATIRRADPRLQGAQLIATRGGIWMQTRKVLSVAGKLLHEDHEAFLQQELSNAGSAAAAIMRLQPLGLQLSQCEVTKLYIVSDQGGAQDNFIQIVVRVEDEYIDRRMFSSLGWLDTPKDLKALVRDAQDGEGIPDAVRPRVRPSAYRLSEVVDFSAFVAEAALLDERRRAGKSRQLLHFTRVFGDGTAVEEEASLGELDPDIMKFAWRGKRLVDDWANSSAGRSGARLCASWAFELSDYTNPQTLQRSMDCIPVWTHTRKMARIKPRNGRSAYELYGKLQDIDRRLGVPFAWYFYMLHGNLVEYWAGERVLEAAEAGLIVLPEHDYRVLKRWAERSYGF